MATTTEIAEVIGADYWDVRAKERRELVSALGVRAPFEIEEVPLPDDAYLFGGTKYPWRETEVGQSFFVATSKPHKVQAAASAIRRFIVGSRWLTRRVNENGLDGVRVWRLA